MNTNKKMILSALLASALVAPLTAPAPGAAAKEIQRPLVQIAVLLDTSNSMDGLIAQAKSQLWKIVNEFISARQKGQRPELEVALFEYGNDGLSAEQGHIRLVQPLTNDLDKISEELFALKTNGGQEYCGWVLKAAVERLAWNPSPSVYKAIFIAGNEPFTQGPVNYADSCKAAIAKGILVNTIHCGGAQRGINEKWQDGALLADGKFMFIDHNQAVVHFDAPQDKEIAQLSAALNRTYVVYGAAGRASAERQLAQDANAGTLASQGAVVQRALAKASFNYRNDQWDLVDAYHANSGKLRELKAEELPAEMRKMDETQRRAYVEAKAKERAEIQAKINQLNNNRNKYVAEQMKQQAGTNTLDTVMISAIRDQAQKKGFNF